MRSEDVNLPRKRPVLILTVFIGASAHSRQVVISQHHAVLSM